ncbi:ferritin light chain-like [Artemia franciscana]|nr:hypothetical protein QYM36_011353 [Artemia franciscana]
MKGLLLILLAAVATASATTCYKQLVNNNKNRKECFSAHRSFNDVNLYHLQNLINEHLEHSLKFTMLASHFNKDIKNRNGFYKYFQGLSDEHWNDALELIDYVTLRGGHLNQITVQFKNGTRRTSDSLSLQNLRLQDERGEKHSLGHALDVTRDLITNIRQLIHKTAAHGTENEDAVLAHFLEEKYTEKYVKKMRELSGFMTVLQSFTTEEEGLALDLFDQYIA